VKDSSIFINEDFRSRLEEQSNNLYGELTIYSAFVKLNALRWLAEIIPEDIEVKIIARWQPNDLVANASDLESYNFCKEKSWQFGIQNTLHSKVFIFDNKTVLLGSANLTDRGLSISSSGNLEVGTVIDASISDLDRLKSLEDGVIWMDDNLFSSITSHIEKIKVNKPKILSWSEELKVRLEKPIELLWINELVWSDPNDLLENLDVDNEDHSHDLDLMGLDIKYISKELLDQKFLNSNVYKFVEQKLKVAETEYTNFGWLSSVLHDALLDTPPPKRVDVKHYVDMIFRWLEFSNLTGIELTKHYRTTSLAFKT